MDDMILQWTMTDRAPLILNQYSGLGLRMGVLLWFDKSRLPALLNLKRAFLAYIKKLGVLLGFIVSEDLYYMNQKGLQEGILICSSSMGRVAVCLTLPVLPFNA